VLAHEIGHVRGRHALRQLIEGAGISAIAVVVLGDMSSVTALASAAPVLLQTRNSRELESEADAFSRQWLRDNHIPERRFDDILCRMIESTGHKGAQLPPFLATHPAVNDRAHCANEGK
jgi:predicted Zn-dependent protease